MYPNRPISIAMASKVQFREDEELLAFLESKGINPNELARDLLEAEVRRMRAADRMERLRARRVRLPRPGAKMVREDREDRDRRKR